MEQQLPGSPVYVFNTHVEAEEAIRHLSDAGIDVKKLSLVGKGYHTEEHPLGFYTVGDRIKAWGGTGAFWAASGACCWRRRYFSCRVWVSSRWQVRLSRPWSARLKARSWSAAYPHWAQP